MRYVRWRAPEVEAVDTIMLGGFGLSAPDPAFDPSAHQNTLYHSDGVCGNRSVSIP